MISPPLGFPPVTAAPLLALDPPLPPAPKPLPGAPLLVALSWTPPVPNGELAPAPEKFEFRAALMMLYCGGAPGISSRLVPPEMVQSAGNDPVIVPKPTNVSAIAVFPCPAAPPLHETRAPNDTVLPAVPALSPALPPAPAVPIVMVSGENPLV